MNINYREWEELEDLAYEEVVKTKKKPKRKKKSWKELNIQFLVCFFLNKIDLPEFHFH